MWKGDRSGVVVAKGKPSSGDLELRDQDTGEVVGFVGSREAYDDALMIDGIRRTQKAIKEFNSRLDIHFGIIAVAERIKRWDIVGEQVVTILETSTDIHNKWKWGPVSSMEGNPEEFMIQNILPRANALFRADTPIADEALIKISNSMIKHYPNTIYGYSNLGALYSVKREFALAEKYLKQALKINPNDQIVLNNLKRLESLRNE